MIKQEIEKIIDFIAVSQVRIFSSIQFNFFFQIAISLIEERLHQEHP